MTEQRFDFAASSLFTVLLAHGRLRNPFAASGSPNLFRFVMFLNRQENRQSIEMRLSQERGVMALLFWDPARTTQLCYRLKIGTVEDGIRCGYAPYISSDYRQPALP